MSRLVRYTNDGIPKEHILELGRIAKTRILVHVQHLNMVDFDLVQYGINCYMQGITDTADALLQQDKAEMPLDYQI